MRASSLSVVGFARELSHSKQATDQQPTPVLLHDREHLRSGLLLVGLHGLALNGGSRIRLDHDLDPCLLMHVLVFQRKLGSHVQCGDLNAELTTIEVVMGLSYTHEASGSGGRFDPLQR